MLQENPHCLICGLRGPLTADSVAKFETNEDVEDKNHVK